LEKVSWPIKLLLVTEGGNQFGAGLESWSSKMPRSKKKGRLLGKKKKVTPIMQSRNVRTGRRGNHREGEKREEGWEKSSEK